MRYTEKVMRHSRPARLYGYQKKAVNGRVSFVTHVSYESTTILFGFMPLVSEQSKANIKLT